MEFFSRQLRGLEQKEKLLYGELQQEISLFREFFELFAEKKKVLAE